MRKNLFAIYIYIQQKNIELSGRKWALLENLYLGTNKFCINRTHTLLQGFDFSRVQVLQGMTSPDTGWGNKLWEQFFVQYLQVQNSETSMLSFIHFRQYIYTLLNRADIFVLDIKMLLMIKVMPIVAKVSNVAPGFQRERDQLRSCQLFAQSIKLRYPFFFYVNCTAELRTNINCCQSFKSFIRSFNAH